MRTLLLWRPLWLHLLLLLLCWSTVVVAARRGATACYRDDDTPIEYVRRSDGEKDDGNYTLVSNSVSMRQLQKVDPVFDHPKARRLTFIDLEESDSAQVALQQDELLPDSMDQEGYPVWRCVCSRHPDRNYYCPTDKPLCFVRYRRELDSILFLPPVCMNLPSKQRDFVRSIWPVLVVMLMLLVTCLLCTRHGNQCLLFLCSSCLPGVFNKVYANFLLSRRPERAKYLVRRWVSRRREQLNERFEELRRNESGTPLNDIEEELVQESAQSFRGNSLKLRTKRFCRDKVESIDNHDNDDATGDEEDDDGCNCAICFGPLEDNDRVGDLLCQHHFHVDCLKLWLCRGRNACPLCQGEAAEASFRNVPNNSNNNNNHSGDEPQER